MEVVLEQVGFVRSIVWGIARGSGADVAATKVETGEELVPHFGRPGGVLPLVS